MSKKLNLYEVCKGLGKIAPLGLAEDWDNVGLLVEGRPNSPVERIFLTIDLTRPVLAEAIRKKADLIVSYHPPIFGGMKRLLRGSAKEEILLDAVRAGISIYSPHTALDATSGGVNDWLMEGLGVSDSRAIKAVQADDSGLDTKLVVFVPEAESSALRDGLAGLGCGQIGLYSDCSFGLSGTGTFRGSRSSSPRLGKKEQLESVAELRLEMVARSRDLGRIESLIRNLHSYEEPAFDFYPLRPRIDGDRGAGRCGRLAKPVPLSTLVRRTKKLLGLSKLRLAKALATDADPLIETIAVCAGAGGSVLMGSQADLFLSGEMRHHDLLECSEKGSHVLLCEHSNTERGYLQRYAKLIAQELEGLNILISEEDADPLKIV